MSEQSSKNHYRCLLANNNSEAKKVFGQLSIGYIAPQYVHLKIKLKNIIIVMQINNKQKSK